MGKSGGGSSTTVQKSDPWSGIQNYLTGGTTTTGGTKNPFTGKVTGGTTTTTTGLYPEAERLYNQSGWNPTMQWYNDQYVQTLASRSGQPQTYYDTANSALSGSFDPNITKVANIAGANNVTPSYMQGSSIQGVGNVNAAQSAGAPNLNAAQSAGANNLNVSMWNNPALVNGDSGKSGYVGDVTSNQAWGGLGSANPTSALSSLLSGKADTSALNSYMDSAMGRMRDNFQESVIPSIGRDAVSTGQYGSSRQGIAEGLAAKGLSQSMGDLASSMYNNAYNTAQSNMYGTANALSSLGLSNSQQNASREQANNQFNASSSLQGAMYNAGVLNNQGQFNANAANNMGQFNATNALNNNQFNANAANNMGQFNASNDLNTQQFNANAGNNMGMYNTTNALNTQQFNANVGNQNNAQELQRAAAALSNRQQGLNMLAGGNSMGDASYNQIMSALQQPNNYNWNNLNNYSQIMSPSLGVGGSTSNSQNSSNSLASMIGGTVGLGAMTYPLWSGLLGGGGAAATGGAVNSGLLSSLAYAAI